MAETTEYRKLDYRDITGFVRTNISTFKLKLQSQLCSSWEVVLLIVF